MCLGHLNSHLFLTHPEAHTGTTTTWVSRMRVVIICHWSCPKVSCFEHELSFKQQIVFRLYRLLSPIFKKPLRSAYFCLWSYLPAASSLPPLSTASSQLAAATQRRPHYPLRRLMLSCLQSHLSWERAWKSECGLCLCVHAGEIGENARDLLQKPVCFGVPTQRQGKVSLLAAVLQGLHLRMPWDCTNCFRKVLEPERELLIFVFTTLWSDSPSLGVVPEGRSGSEVSETELKQKLGSGPRKFSAAVGG